MPRFFFDILTDGAGLRDDTGLELPDWEAARRETTQALACIARDELPGRSHQCDITADVRDETGRLGFSACLSFTARWVGQAA